MNQHIFIRASKRWWGSDPITHGAAIAYFVILSVAPLLLLFVTVLGKIFSRQAIELKFLSTLQGFAGSSVSGLMTALIQYFDNPRSGTVAALISAALVIIGSLSLFSQIQRSLTMVWYGTDVSRQKTFLRTKFVAFIMVIVLGLFIITSFAIGPAIHALTFIARVPVFSGLTHGIAIMGTLGMLSGVVTAVYVGGLFLLLYKYLPGGAVSWRAAINGSVFGTILFFVGRYVLDLYITTQVALSVYGAAGAIVLILVWSFYSSQLFLFGAALARVSDDEINV